MKMDLFTMDKESEGNNQSLRKEKANDQSRDPVSIRPEDAEHHEFD
jgi:hypothetical protein